jgi:PIN domain nuclease of toxin-antitoxin system
MRYLLDTHTLLWAAADIRQLPLAVQSVIAGEHDAECWTSTVCLWEIIIKAGNDKLSLDRDPVRWTRTAVRDLTLGTLPITSVHAEEYARLPRWEDHRDPFDRMLAAQARAEAMVLVTRDANLHRYGPRVLWSDHPHR